MQIVEQLLIIHQSFEWTHPFVYMQKQHGRTKLLEEQDKLHSKSGNNI